MTLLPRPVVTDYDLHIGHSVSTPEHEDEQTAYIICYTRRHQEPFRNGERYPLLVAIEPNKLACDGDDAVLREVFYRSLIHDLAPDYYDVTDVMRELVAPGLVSPIREWFTGHNSRKRSVHVLLYVAMLLSPPVLAQGSHLFEFDRNFGSLGSKVTEAVDQGPFFRLGYAAGQKRLPLSSILDYFLKEHTFLQPLTRWEHRPVPDDTPN